MNKTIDAQVKCPYYLGEDRNTVACEGVIEGTRLVSRFMSLALKRAFMSEHCLSCFGRGCELAEYLNGKYG